MSIIHEALKKVQSDRSENIPVLKPPPGQTKTLPEPSGISIWLWAFLTTSLGAIGVYNFYQYTLITRQMATTKFYASQAVVTPLAVEKPAVTPKPPQAKKDDLVLFGVVEMDGKNYALINNEFYEAGEKAAGRTITKITTDSIEILEKGKTKTIKVLRPN